MIYIFFRGPIKKKMTVWVLILSYRWSCGGCEWEESWWSDTQTGCRDPERHWTGENSGSEVALRPLEDCASLKANRVVFYKSHCLGGASVNGERSAPKRPHPCPSDATRHFWTSERSRRGTTTTTSKESRIQLHYSRYEMASTHLLMNI